MIKHTFFSLLSDLKAFMGLIKTRLKAIDKCPSDPVTGVTGVNILGEELHNDSMKVKVRENKKAQFGRFITLSSADGRDFPPYKSGQYLIIKPGIVGVRNSRAYYIVSSKKDSCTVFVPSTEDKDIEVFAGSGEEAEFTAGTPYGNCFYQPLRDSGNIYVISDKQGFGAAESFRQNTELSKITKIYTFFGKTFDKDEENPQLAVFLREALHGRGSLFIFGAPGFVNLMRQKAAEQGFARKYIRYEIITPSPGLRYGDRKYICHIIRGSMSKDIVCSSDITLSQSFELAGIESHVKCMSGECGYCRCRLIKGDVNVKPQDNEDHLRKADAASGYIHPCISYPKSDITVIL